MVFGENCVESHICVSRRGHPRRRCADAGGHRALHKGSYAALNQPTSNTAVAAALHKPSKLVVACLDGRRLKGYVFNFSPLRDRFRLFPEETSPAQAGTDVEFASLKAVFFVKEFAGKPDHHDHYDLSAPHRGRVLEVKFRDGEKIIGVTEAWNPKNPGFFMVPADPESNNIRIFVINRNVDEVRML